MTVIFNTYKDFLNREDRSANGVGPEFAEKHPNWEEMNETNRACWNCVDCRYCKHCWNCVDCRYCKGCTDCVDCWDCVNCVRCTNDDGPITAMTARAWRENDKGI